MPTPLPARLRPTTSRSAGWLASIAAALLLAVLPAGAQEELEDVFGGLGTADAVEGEEAARAREGEGTIVGQVFDGASGAPIADVTVIVAWPQGPDGGPPKQEIQVTDGFGSFEFPSVPPGRYSLSFVKSGYRASAIANFEVLPDQLNRADFPLPPVERTEAGDVLELDPFVVDVTTVNELMSNLELRLDSDQLLNIMNAEELARFAASDVADALKRVAGVNIVEGQFAIIRGLEDRYSSTTFNGAPLPSPDPTSQSVQLDLFPSDVVSNLVVAKTFAADAPGNSAGGSIDIVTTDYPEQLEVKVSLGTGFEEYAIDRFLGLNDGSATGKELDGKQVIESDIGGSIGGRRDFFERDVRFKLVANWETDYRTKEGFQEGRQPRRRNLPTDRIDDQIIPRQSGDLSYGLLGLSNGQFDLTQSEREEQKTAFAGFGFDLDEAGHHRIDTSVFYTKKESEIVQLKENGFIPGYDYAPLIDRTVGGDFFLETSVFDNFSTIGSWITRDLAEEAARSDLPLFWYNFTESRGIQIDRDLLVYQINGEHEFDSLDGLEVTWAANQARTTQTEEASRSRIASNPAAQDPPLGFPGEFNAFLQDLTFPVSTPGLTYTAGGDLLFSQTDIEENQDFARLDAEYDTRLFDLADMTARAGGWYERAKRSVDADFLAFPTFDAAFCATSPTCTSSASGSRGTAFGSTLESVGRNQQQSLLRSPDGTFAGNQPARNDSEREIWSFNVDSKFTFWDKLDLLSGLRIESIEISSRNQAISTAGRGNDTDLVRCRDDLDSDPGSVRRLCVSEAKEVFPSRYLFFDRQDDRSINEIEPRPGQFPIFNDEILGIDVADFRDPNGILNIPCRPTLPPGSPGRDESRPCASGSRTIDDLINGRIDNTYLLPTVSLGYRPIERMSLRAAWSRTVARPSFRELGYYVTIPVNASGLVVGNPQLGLSEVESIDGRLEYTWGEFGDLFALSAFYKTIEDPVEQIVIRDPSNNESTSLALYRTFFNNPNTATLWGIELELRKNLGFLSGELFGWDLPDVDLLEYFAIGGNFTWIDAEVKRTDAQRQRAAGFFGTLDGDPPARFNGLSKTRRLFGQPEWIVNADISFDHPDWGTRITLAIFAISDVLDAAGSAGIATNGTLNSFTLDQYVEGFHQLDLVWSQHVWRGLTFKTSIKNLTDSWRGLVYDPDGTTSTYRERRYRQGRDYSFAFTWTQAF